MFQLLLVDDEQAILNGLYNNVDWFELGIDEVYKAADTVTAIKIMEERRIDVVITDICMPGEDGLMLCQRIKEQWPMVKIILLSGYREFAYAKRGMELGAYAYVTKPVSYEEIGGIVSGALTRIEEELNKEALLKQAKKAVAQAGDVLKERFLNRYLKRGFTGEWDGEMFRKCGFLGDPEEPVILVMVRRDRDFQDVWEANFLEYMLPDITKSISGEKMELLSFCDWEDNVAILVHGRTRETLGSIYEKLPAILDGVQLSIKKTFKEDVSIFWSRMTTLKELPECYQKICLQMNQVFWSEESVLSGPEEPEKEKKAVLESLLLYPPFPVLVETLKAEAAEKRLHLIFREIREKGCFSMGILLNIYYMVAHTISEDSMKRKLSMEKQFWQGGLENFMVNFGSSHSMEGLEDNCVKAVVEYISFVKEKKTDLAGSLMKGIKGYIHENLSKPLAVSQIAEEFGYNASYLTRLFKRETGYSINDYLIHARMEKAGELLKIPGEKVNEISRMVGYENVSHFSRLFKKLYGVSPKQYQSM